MTLGSISTWMIIATLLGGAAALVALLKDGAGLLRKRESIRRKSDDGYEGESSFEDPLAARFESVVRARRAVGLGAAAATAAAVELAHHHPGGAPSPGQRETAGSDARVDDWSGTDIAGAGDVADAMDAADVGEAGGGLLHLLDAARSFFTH